MMDFRVSALP